MGVEDGASLLRLPGGRPIRADNRSLADVTGGLQQPQQPKGNVIDLSSLACFAGMFASAAHCSATVCGQIVLWHIRHPRDYFKVC
jgi:hypothetical protein